MSSLLSHRALNRATLARQHLLARSEMGIAAAVEHLVGLQAHHMAIGKEPAIRLLDCFRAGIQADNASIRFQGDLLHQVEDPFRRIFGCWSGPGRS